MDKLSAQQKSVLRKMRSGDSLVEYFHNYYIKHGQYHDFRRFFDYKMIAYYLYEDQRKLIEQYYQDRGHQQMKEEQKAYFGQLCAALKQFNQKVSSYVYREGELETKDELFYENKGAKEKEERQKAEKLQSMHSNSLSFQFSSIWKYVCLNIFGNELSVNHYKKSQNIKQI